ncbi:MAG: guanylate kinase [Candidatus Omnitrophota bacterium]|nr:guanylate kinase [Candidatus Omnitrophota bacterium]
MVKPRRKSCPGRGKLFVISAPSGCGKTTLCRRLLDDSIDLVNSVSMTTRPPRPGEKNGVDYRFVSRKYFQDMIRSRTFLEYEENFGHLYGTPGKFIQDNLKKGRSVLLSIDVKGAMKVRKVYGRNSVLIFILPPSIRVLKNRLYSRMSDDAETIAQRLKNARRELSYKDRYDYRIINDTLDSAYKRLKNIVIS